MPPNDKLTKALDLIPMGPGEFKTPVTQNPENKDYEYARQNVYQLIEKGNEALEELSEIVRQTQNLKSFEVLNALIGTLTKSNKDLLELQKWNHEIKEKAKKSEEMKEPGSTITNVFVGSTSDLQKMIEQMKGAN